MEEGFMQGKGTGVENFGSNPINSHVAFEVSSAVRALNTSVPEMEISLVAQVESRETVGGIELRPW